MKNDNATDNVENKPDGQPVKPVKPAKPAKPKKEKKQTGGVHLPFLLEFTYTISTVILIFLAVAIIFTSVLAGASLFTALLRAGVAILAVGGLLMLISSQIASGLLFAAKIEQEEADKKLEEEEEKKQEKEPVFPPMNEDAVQAEAA